MISATIESIRQATPTIKVLRILPESKFSFKAGQWLDCYVDLTEGRNVVGYTLTSSPTEETLELAVRYSDSNPITLYIHKAAMPGDTLLIDGGHGDTYFEKGMANNLVLIAGGIGITPIMSIIRYVADSVPETHVKLLYSARTSSELLYKQEIDELSAKTSRIKPFYTVTRESWLGRQGRIDELMIREAGLEAEALHYICGPKDMIQDVVGILGRLGVRRKQMKYEVW